MEMVLWRVVEMRVRSARTRNLGALSISLRFGESPSLDGNGPSLGVVVFERHCCSLILDLAAKLKPLCRCFCASSLRFMAEPLW